MDDRTDAKNMCLPAEEDPARASGMTEGTGMLGPWWQTMRHWRLTKTVVPAAAITAALFFGMQQLITVDEIAVDEREHPPLMHITPQQQTKAAVRTERQPVKKIEAQTPPPPPAVRRFSAGDIDIPAPVLSGVAPSDAVLRRIEPIVLQTVAVLDTSARPISPPVVKYPDGAAKIGLEGNCEVRFDVSAAGIPMNVEADCTDRIFEREAVRAVSRVQFAPKIVRGQRVERRNVVYPLEFRMQVTER